MDTLSRVFRSIRYNRLLLIDQECECASAPEGARIVRILPENLASFLERDFSEDSLLLNRIHTFTSSAREMRENLKLLQAHAEKKKRVYVTVEYSGYERMSNIRDAAVISEFASILHLVPKEKKDRRKSFYPLF